MFAKQFKTFALEFKMFARELKMFSSIPYFLYLAPPGMNALLHLGTCEKSNFLMNPE